MRQRIEDIYELDDIKHDWAIESFFLTLYNTHTLHDELRLVNKIMKEIFAQNYFQYQNNFRYSTGFEDRTSCEILAMNLALQNHERGQKWYRARRPALELLTQNLVDSMVLTHNAKGKNRIMLSSSYFSTNKPNLDLYENESKLASYILSVRKAKTADLQATIAQFFTKMAALLTAYHIN